MLTEDSILPGLIMLTPSSRLRLKLHFLVALVISLGLACTAAPLQEYSEIQHYSEGCYYNYNYYNEGDRILTNEPCLNCTCHNKMLMCYLRVCPFTKPIGHDCTIEKREDQCCPIITCPEVPVELLDQESGNHLAVPKKHGCTVNGKYYPEGAQVPSSPNKPCELCYCIHNRTSCLIQECTLHVNGCQPIYHRNVCCPVRYNCDHDDENELVFEDEMTTTVRPTPGFILTTTLSPTVSSECVHNGIVYNDGESIKSDQACEHCYCMRGDIVCAVQECKLPLDKQGANCTALPAEEGDCCPSTYVCSDTDENEIIQPTENVTVYKSEVTATTTEMPFTVFEHTTIESQNLSQDIHEGISEEDVQLQEHIDDKSEEEKKSEEAEESNLLKGGADAEETKTTTVLPEGPYDKHVITPSTERGISLEETTKEAAGSAVTHIQEGTTPALTPSEEYTTPSAITLEESATPLVTQEEKDKPALEEESITPIIKTSEEGKAPGEKEGVASTERSFEEKERPELIPSEEESTTSAERPSEEKEKSEFIPSEEESTTPAERPSEEKEKPELIPSEENEKPELILSEEESTTPKGKPSEEKERPELIPSEEESTTPVVRLSEEKERPELIPSEEESTTPAEILSEEKGKPDLIPSAEESTTPAATPFEEKERPEITPSEEKEEPELIPSQEDSTTPAGRPSEDKERPELIPSEEKEKPELIPFEEESTTPRGKPSEEKERPELIPSEEESTTPVGRPSEEKGRPELILSEEEITTPKAELVPSEEESTTLAERPSEDKERPELIPSEEKERPELIPSEEKEKPELIPSEEESTTPAEKLSEEKDRPEITPYEKESITPSGRPSEEKERPEIISSEEESTTPAEKLFEKTKAPALLHGEESATTAIIHPEEKATPTEISSEEHTTSIPSTTEPTPRPFEPEKDHYPTELPKESAEDFQTRFEQTTPETVSYTQAPYYEENEIVPIAIPGEGDCLVDEVTYKNNSSVPPANVCDTNCICFSSLIVCQKIKCEDPPSSDCTITEDSSACCPTYNCRSNIEGDLYHETTTKKYEDISIEKTDQLTTQSTIAIETSSTKGVKDTKSELGEEEGHVDMPPVQEPGKEFQPESLITMRPDKISDLEEDVTTSVEESKVTQAPEVAQGELDLTTEHTIDEVEISHVQATERPIGPQDKYVPKGQTTIAPALGPVEITEKEEEEKVETTENTPTEPKEPIHEGEPDYKPNKTEQVEKMFTTTSPLYTEEEATTSKPVGELPYESDLESHLATDHPEIEEPTVSPVEEGISVEEAESKPVSPEKEEEEAKLRPAEEEFAKEQYHEESIHIPTESSTSSVEEQTEAALDVHKPSGAPDEIAHAPTPGLVQVETETEEIISGDIPSGTELPSPSSTEEHATESPLVPEGEKEVDIKTIPELGEEFIPSKEPETGGGTEAPEAGTTPIEGLYPSEFDGKITEQPHIEDTFGDRLEPSSTKGTYTEDIFGEVEPEAGQKPGLAEMPQTSEGTTEESFEVTMVPDLKLPSKDFGRKEETPITTESTLEMKPFEVTGYPISEQPEVPFTGDLTKENVTELEAERELEKTGLESEVSEENVEEETLRKVTTEGIIHETTESPELIRVPEYVPEKDGNIKDILYPGTTLRPDVKATEISEVSHEATTEQAGVQTSATEQPSAQTSPTEIVPEVVEATQPSAESSTQKPETEEFTTSAPEIVSHPAQDKFATESPEVSTPGDVEKEDNFTYQHIETTSMPALETSTPGRYNLSIMDIEDIEQTTRDRTYQTTEESVIVHEASSEQPKDIIDRFEAITNRSTLATISESVITTTPSLLDIITTEPPRAISPETEVPAVDKVTTKRPSSSIEAAEHVDGGEMIQSPQKATEKPIITTAENDIEKPDSNRIPPQVQKQPGYGQLPPQYPSYSEDDYTEEDEGEVFGPGTCRYGGKLFVSAQQIPRDDPCDFCFCFRSDIICLQQSCPPPISGCHEEPIHGFCCPRYECPVSMGLDLNSTTTTTTTTTLPPHFLHHAYRGLPVKNGCHIQGKSYKVGDKIESASGPCMHCSCGGDGQMKCEPKTCTPEPMLRQMIAVVASRRR